MDVTRNIPLSSFEVLPVLPRPPPAVRVQGWISGQGTSSSNPAQGVQRLKGYKKKPQKKALNFLWAARGEVFSSIFPPGGIRAPMGALCGLAGLPAPGRAGQAPQFQPASRVLGEVLYLPGLAHYPQQPNNTLK